MSSLLSASVALQVAMMVNKLYDACSLRETACKIRYNHLCIRFGTCKVRRVNQSRSKAKLPAEARREERLSRSKFE